MSSMFSGVKKRFDSCWKPAAKTAHDDDSDGGAGNMDDRLLWSLDLERHSFGEFSMAVVQSNKVLEDHSQVEARKESTFVGVYDGHGGPDASRFICSHLYHHLIRLSEQLGNLSEEALRCALFETETQFLTSVPRTSEFNPLIAAVSSCCLVGVISKENLLIANIGNSRAVMGSLRRFKRIKAEQLTSDDNANSKEVKLQLRAQHPDDPQIVLRKQGLIQVPGAIGDAYLKSAEFALGPSYPRFYLPDPITRAVLRSELSVSSRALRPADRFLIFASDGLWEHISNQSAVETVQRHPRTGIARRLVHMALNAASRKSGIKYDKLKLMKKGKRRNIHDDILVAVVFIDYEMLSRSSSVPDVSVRGFEEKVGPLNSGAAAPGPSNSGADTARPSGCGLYCWTVGFCRNPH